MTTPNLAAVDLNLLLVLDRLLSTGSVTAAARELGVTQPALSRSLQRLREVLADPLFVRAGRGLTPTPRALALADPLREALEAVGRVVAPPEAFDPATATGTFTLALGDESQVGFTDAIAGAIWRHAPGIDLRIRALTATALDESRRGAIDLAVAPDLSPLPGGAGMPDIAELHRRFLYRRRFVVASSPDHPRPTLTLGQYVAADHVIVSFEGGGWGFVDDLLAERGLRRRVAASVTSFHSAAAVALRTKLLVTLPEEVARAVPGGLVCCPPPLPLPDLDVLMLWHPRVHTSPRQRFLRELVAGAVLERVGAPG